MPNSGISSFFLDPSKTPFAEYHKTNPTRQKECVAMIPTSGLFDQSVMSALLEHDPVVQHYRAFFALLDWSLVDDFQAQRSPRGRPAYPQSAYLKAFLIRQCEGFMYTSQLHRFLLKHPLLVIELGFHLVLDPSAHYGFDVQQTLPCRYWFTQKLRFLDRSLLQALLHATVAALQQEIAGLGEVVAFDVKHIYAWVKQNNPRAYVPDRYNKEQILSGDPECKLGVKRSSNQDASLESDQPEPPSTQAKAPSTTEQKRKKPLNQATSKKEQPSKEKKEYIWDYDSGADAATNPLYGEVVLAEYTLPVHQGD